MRGSRKRRKRRSTYSFKHKYRNINHWRSLKRRRHNKAKVSPEWITKRWQNFRGVDSKRITRAWQTTRAYELDSMAYGRDSKGFRKGLTSVWKGLNAKIRDIDR